MNLEKEEKSSLNILIINPFGIGDILFTTPVIACLKAHFTDSVITYWCNERVEHLFKDNPKIDHVIACSRGDLKRAWKQSSFSAIKRFIALLSRIKKGKFDMVFDFSLDHRYGRVSKLLGIKRRVGFNYKKRGRFLTDAVTINGYEDRHIVQYYLDLLKCVGIRPTQQRLELFIPRPRMIKSEIVLESLGLAKGDLVIGIAPGAGASWGQDARLKHWPAIRFAQLAERIIREFGAKVILIGDKTERSIAEEVVFAMKHKALDLVGKTLLEEIPALISNFNMLIANDGGLLHIAVALDIPTVSIFGPVSDVVYGPWPVSEKHRVIKKTLSCQPCYAKFKLKTCAHERECINAITTEEVFQAVSLQLKKTPGRICAAGSAESAHPPSFLGGV